MIWLRNEWKVVFYFSLRLQRTFFSSLGFYIYSNCGFASASSLITYIKCSNRVAGANRCSLLCDPPLDRFTDRNSVSSLDFSCCETFSKFSLRSSDGEQTKKKSFRKSGSDEPFSNFYRLSVVFALKLFPSLRKSSGQIVRGLMRADYTALR